MYAVNWIDNYRFKVEDRDYSHKLCEISFSQDVIDSLAPHELYELSENIKEIIVKKYVDKEDD